MEQKSEKVATVDQLVFQGEIISGADCKGRFSRQIELMLTSKLCLVDGWTSRYQDSKRLHFLDCKVLKTKLTRIKAVEN